MTTPTTSPAPLRRPLLLSLAAITLLLAALLSFAAPFLSRVGGVAGGQPPPGAPPQGGQAPGQGQPPADAANQAAGLGQPPAGAFNGPPSAPTGTASVLMNLLQPLRIAEGVAGGLLALAAALGLWRLKKWGRNLALILTLVSLLAAAATFLTPLLGRSPWLMLVSGATWSAVAGAVLATLGAGLALLPAAQKAYVTKPKQRRVM